jgi:excinuclease ABC subunit B
MDFKDGVQQAYIEPDQSSIAADPIVQFMSKSDLKKTIEETRKTMLVAAKDMDFLLAAKLRDEMFVLENILKDK